ncbi:FAD-dependent oxidoreductase [Wenzhouxiangella sp. XN79A]|uniref:FAD-dependent oxidoreductase n=1 Tax=Wenzhouxiangella sp. XN79A TaxID=2724193 RepID=UPI00144A79FF|nr:bifunctional TVP38/TMEM64 family protein/FAD-dependent oxidoreductase [Wenzhouxiangella sp. XN79A]NKI35512.1 FAD-dependent oxidoreductase [Wenzhouxiangella sp. XN79A]
MNRTLPRLLLLTALAALIGVFFWLDLGQYFSLDELRARRDQLLAYIDRNFLLALVIYVGAYILMAALSLPGAAILTLAGGALFGLLAGTVAVSLASTIGATLVFLAARFLFHDAVQNRFGKRLKRINEGVERDGAFYLLALRLVPIFPFWVINLVMALTPIRTWTYAWVSLVGMFPATVVYVNAGTQLARVDTVGDVLSPGLIGAFVLLGLLPLITRWILRLLNNRKVYAGHDKPTSFDYNLIVIGAGSAGLVSSLIGSTVKAKVALVEKHRMGGDCLNTGCVPSKALLRTARLVQEARDSRDYGIRSMTAEFDWQEVMQRVHSVIETIEPHDSPERYRGLGVDVMLAEGRLISPWAVEVTDEEGTRTITARSIVLATGAEPLVPPIDGLDQVPSCTSDTLWDLDTQPERLLVLGGGPIGCELGQAFARLGSKVTIVEMGERLLQKEDVEASRALTARLEAEGVTVATGHRAVRFERAEVGGVAVCQRTGDGSGDEVRFEFDRVLVALGRRARTKGFGLEELGIEIADGGTIATDDFLRTTFPNVYVCGDAAGPYQFTHVASHQAWFASVNGLLAPFWSFRADYRVIPWATFTDPEVARVGLNEQDAAEQDVDVEVTTYGIDDLDRAIADSAAHGFVKVLTEPGKDRILGATIVGPHASELIAEFVLAMKHGLGLNKILSTIHIYPTLNEANKFAAGEWKKARKPETLLKLAERFFAWRRR